MVIGEGVVEDTPDELLTFAPREDGNGLEIVDHIERRHFSIHTTKPVSPHESPGDIFEFPVSRAVTIEADRLFIPHQFGVLVRNSLGLLIDEIVKGDQRSLPKDQYCLDPLGPVKTYITFNSSCSIDVSANGININLEAVSQIHIGARSQHKRPAATITATRNATDLMEAISYFSSSLKTTTCERSFPTLRGHPPKLEMGEELRIPSVLKKPETGIKFEIPKELSYVFASTSLAYYLGANVVPGDTPRILTKEGLEYSLNNTLKKFNKEVEQLLKQIFFLDCITRTEGYYPLDLHERNVIEDIVDLNFTELYNLSIATQIEKYLEVPFRLIEPHLPKWKQTACITPDFEYADTLPFLASDLAVIKTEETRLAGPSTAHSLAVDDFVRNYSESPRSRIESAPTPPLIRVNEENSMEHTWIGEGAPLGASKGMSDAYINRLGRPMADHDIGITVICNAPEMGQERDLVNEVYGSRDELPFDVTIHRELSTNELREVLEEETDFLHYIGHIDAGGFECSDGRFDVTSLSESGVDVFFLNACTSYEQGIQLIKKGSIAGVVTLQDVINSGAERVGMTLARLLNYGFPLQVALNIAKKESIMGGHYLVVGDGGIEITQPEDDVPALYHMEEGSNSWSLEYITFPTRIASMGSVTCPSIEGCDEFHITSGRNGKYTLKKPEVKDLLKQKENPIRVGGELTWSSEYLSKLT